MAYKLTGYSTPLGVDSREKVREWQSRLGVATDGIWGPKTQAAYEAATRSQTPAQDALLNYKSVWNIPPDVLEAANRERDAASPMRAYMSAINELSSAYDERVNAAFGVGNTKESAGSGETLFNEYYNSILASIHIPTVSVSVPSQGQIRSEAEAYLRPAADSAIEDIVERSEETRAELEADANARGMGASTFVSSMKQRESARADRSAAGVEANYLAALSKNISESMQYYARLKADADMTNAQMYASAQSQAMSLAGAWYSSYMQSQYEMAKSAYSSGLSGLGGFMDSYYSQQGSSTAGASASSGGKGGSGNKNSGYVPPTQSSLTRAEGMRLLGYLSEDERALMFNSGAAKWREARDDLTLAVGKDVMADYKSRTRDSIAAKPGKNTRGGGTSGGNVRYRTI